MTILDKPAIIWTAMIYLALVVAIGIWAVRRTRSAKDFFIAGQGIGLLVTALATLPIAGEAGRVPRATFLVGPEGGFTPEEVTWAVTGGFRRLRLPLPVLRTPTALALLGALGALLAEPGTSPFGALDPSSPAGRDPARFSR